MRIVIAGAGAIGGFIGARLAKAGADVVLFARGPQLRAIEERGLRLVGRDGEFEVRPRVSADLRAIGPADVVFVSVKAHSLPSLAPQLRALFGADTAVVSTQNGIPWWYFQNHDGERDGLRLESVDPGGVIGAVIEPERVIGSVLYLAASIVQPGVIRHVEGNRIVLGEPDGAKSDRLETIAVALGEAGFHCPVTTCIRTEIWVKLLGNVVFNPISALTGGTLEEIGRHPQVSALVRDVMAETIAVAARLGVDIPMTIDQRIAIAVRVGAHKTSMLQDLEAGRPMELEPVVAAVVELGDRLGVAMPATRAIYACVKMLDEKRCRA